MLDEDLEPRKKKPVLKNLDVMSVEELEDYVAEMKTEIERVAAEIKKKRAYRDAASSFFKK